MKTMRYRIRVIALILVTTLLILVFWCVHDIWFPAGFSPAVPAETASPSATPSVTPSFPVTTQAEWWETAAPSPATDVLTPEPLFDTFGL